MSQSQEPSLLEYARFHGIATNPTTIDPLEYIDLTFDNSDSFDHEDISSFENNISTTQASIEQDLRREKLNVNKDDARFLSTVIRNARAERVDVNWNDCLPAMRRIEGLKVEIPALATHHETDMAPLRQHTFFGRAGGALSLVKGCSSYPTADCSNDFVKMSLELVDNIRMERLNCTKGSLILIQKARKCGVNSPRDMDFYFETLLRPYQRRSVEPGSPVTPIDFDEIYSPPPTPKPRMLPSPVSLNRFEQHGLQHGIPKTGKSASSHSKTDCVGESRISSSLGFDNREILVIQAGEELRLSNERQPTPIEQPYQKSLVVESEPNEGEITGIGNKDVSNDVRHRLELQHNPVRSARSHSHSTIRREGVNSEAGPACERKPSMRLQSMSSYPTFQSSLHFSSQAGDNEHNELPLGHSVDRHPRVLTEEAHPALLETVQGLSEPQYETYLEGDVDSREIVERNGSTPTKQKNEKQHIPTTTGYLGAKPMSASSITIENTISCDQQIPGCPADQPCDQRKKRKKSKRDSSSRKQQRRPEQKAAVSQARAVNKVLSSPFTALGSLSSFMETRGKVTKQVNAKSPYFTSNSNQSNDNQNLVADISTGSHIEPDIEIEQQVSIASTIPTHHIPQYSRNNQKPPLLFLSTTLLKSHRGLIQILESMKHPSPVLVYRDYDKELSRTTNNKSITRGLQHEADIIISPSTGILLTTSQATTQLYLPGHKPSHPQLDGIKGINSPLRERIMLLAPRYEQLYIFIYHPGGTAKKPLGKSTGPTADKRTLASMTSLMAFCSSAMEYSTITTLLLTPPAPENVAEWILSLACKHSFELPESNLPRSTSTGFTPINPNKTNAKLNPESIETETQWELFLRHTGLNPFAAQAILAVLRREEENEVGGLRLSGGSVAGESTNIPALSRFIEMTTERRRRLFAGLIGDKVLRRIEGMVDNDWQCDWALNFDAFTQA